jgi:DNA-binding response OmpR family regulator
MRLLLVEDNDRLAQLVVKGLTSAGLTLDRVGCLEEADAALAAARFDAVVLDLPDGDGADWLRTRRAAGMRVPVLMLTARASTGEKVKGLNSGADDYLAKPFEMDELVARVKALLRRPGGVLGLILELGRLSYDTVHREASVAGRRLALSASELTLLELLLRRVGRVVSRRMLEEGLYGFDDDVGPNSLEAHVSRLRKKLEAADSGVQIHSLRGIGYLAGERGAGERGE